MTSATWDVTNFSDDKYNNPLNWNDSTIPGSTDTAFFGTSNQTSVSITTDNKVGTWMFNKDAENYSVNIGFVALDFYLAGIVINGGSVHITNSGMLSFFNNSTAGNAVITNTHDLFFLDGSTAGNATIFSGDGSLFTNALAFVGDALRETQPSRIIARWSFKKGRPAVPRLSTTTLAARSISLSHQVRSATISSPSDRLPGPEPMSLVPTSSKCFQGM